MILTRMETRQRGGVSDIQPIFLVWFGHWFAKIKIQSSSKSLEGALILSPPPFPPHWTGSDARCSDVQRTIPDPTADRSKIRNHNPSVRKWGLSSSRPSPSPSAKVLGLKGDKKAKLQPFIDISILAPRTVKMKKITGYLNDWYLEEIEKGCKVNFSSVSSSVDTRRSRCPR